MSRFEDRMQLLRDLADELNDDESSIIVLEQRGLLHKLVRKHMESLQSLYRGRIQSLLEAAMRVYVYPTAREEILRPYMFSADERRYIDDVIKALEKVQKPDYLPSEE